MATYPGRRERHTLKRSVHVRLLNEDEPWTILRNRKRHTLWSRLWYGRYQRREEQVWRGIRRHGGPTSRRRRSDRGPRSLHLRHPYVRYMEKTGRTREGGARKRSRGALRGALTLCLLHRPIDHPMSGVQPGEGIRGHLRRSVRALVAPRTRTAPRTRRTSTHPVSKI